MVDNLGVNLDGEVDHILRGLQHALFGHNAFYTLCRVGPHPVGHAGGSAVNGHGDATVACQLLGKQFVKLGTGFLQLTQQTFSVGMVDEYIEITFPVAEQGHFVPGTDYQIDHAIGSRTEIPDDLHIVAVVSHGIGTGLVKTGSRGTGIKCAHLIGDPPPSVIFAVWSFTSSPVILTNCISKAKILNSYPSPPSPYPRKNRFEGCHSECDDFLLLTFHSCFKQHFEPF